MRKQDLVSGMILETRNGKRYLFVNGNIVNFDGYVMFSNYSEDLKNELVKNCDVVKVYEIEIAYSLTDIFKDANLTLIWERKEYELTDREIEVLKVLSLLGYEWLARDENDGLYTYVGKPEKRTNCNYWNGASLVRLRKIESLFKFVKWTDDEPTKIDDLLKGV